MIKILEILIVAVYSISSLSAGIFILNMTHRRCLINRHISAVAFLGISFVIGTGFYATIWSLLLSSGFFSLSVVILVLLIGLGSGAKSIWLTTCEAIKQILLLKKDFQNEDRIWKLLIVLTLCIIGLTICTSFRPLHPQGDASAFYMALPKLLAISQKITYLPGYENFTTIGLIGEFNYAALMAMGAGDNAKLISLFIIIVCALILSSFARFVGCQRRGQWIAVLILFSSSAVTLLAGDGKVDLFAAMFGLCTFYILFTNENKNIKIYFLAGLIAGFSLIAKLSYAPLILPCSLLYIAWKCKAEKPLSSCLRGPILFLLGTLIPISVHMYKNWALLHEPLAPFYYFQGNPFDVNWVEVNKQWFSDAITSKILITYPLALVFGKFPMQYGNISFLIVAFIPLAIVLPNNLISKNNAVFQLSFLGIIGILIWVILRPSVLAPRYFLYTTLILIPLASYCAELMFNKNISPKWFANSIIICCIVSALLCIYSNKYYAFQGLRAVVKPATKLEPPVVQASLMLNKLAEKGDRVFSLNYFTYWMRADLLKSMSTKWEMGEALKEGKNNGHIWNFIHSNQFKYVLINSATHSDIDRFLKLEKVPDYLHVFKVFEKNDYKIYEVKSTI